jgi:tetratricopeptide (TPR) repeat protein
MSNPDPQLQSAVELHRLGRLEEARASYQQIVDAHPARADVMNLLGTALRQMGRYAEAVEMLSRAVSLDPTKPVYFGNLGEAHRGLGQLDDAIACYKQAARLAPYLAEIHSNLGALLQQAGRLAEAGDSYAQALRCDPRHADALYNLGNLFQIQRQWDRAIDAYRQALSIKPDYVDAQCNLANALREQGDPQEALRWLQSALALAPDSVPALANLGVALQDLGQPDRARPFCERAIELAPERAVLHVNLGTAHKDLGDPQTALDCYDRALALAPDDPQALHSRGTALLALGDFAAGWAGYEHRTACDQFDTRDFPQPRWDGAPLAGRKLLIHAEQGLGDTLQFIRYVPLASARGGPVMVVVQPALVPLLRTSGVPNVLSSAEPLPPFDVQAPLMSLPYIFQTGLDTVPRDVPYLAVEPQRIETWRQHLSARPGLNVGIVWQGRPEHRRDRLRSFPLESLAPLAAVPGVQLFSLQKGPGSEQLTALSQGQGRAATFEVVDLGRTLDNEGPLFLDTAAAMKSLDLVITPDTSTAHLAGGLAVPVWIALPLGAEWRWMTRREDSPWYPTMRLFRQTSLGDWTELFGRMADALHKLADEKRRTLEAEGPTG